MMITSHLMRFCLRNVPKLTTELNDVGAKWDIALPSEINSHKIYCSWFDFSVFLVCIILDIVFVLTLRARFLSYVSCFEVAGQQWHQDLLIMWTQWPIDIARWSIDLRLFCLYVCFSKEHPWDRSYSTRIKTSNVYSIWAPVNPIVQGTSCAG